MLETAALLLALSVGAGSATPSAPAEQPPAIVETVDQITSGLEPYVPPVAEPEPEPEKPAEPVKPAEPQKPWVNPYGQTLATCTTRFNRSQTNRNTNIQLATKACNGYVIQPGATFSYNQVVGQRTAARGYKEAGVYINGSVASGLGGGICQVSSTLFNAALESNMTIVQRTAHSLPVSYLPKGRDATVSWGGPDFKFKNPYKFPVMVGTYYSASQGTLTMSILGPSDAKIEKGVIKVTGKNGVYTTTRTVGGKVNYTTTSKYGVHP